jgi:hypothetical protein
MNAARITVPANIQHLLTLARAPGPVRDALFASRATLDLPRVAELARAHGVDVTVEQLESFSRSLPVPTDLSDADLEGVTGGVSLLAEFMNWLLNHDQSTGGGVNG